MKMIPALLIGALTLFIASVSFAQDGRMMNGSGWGSGWGTGWMGGYGGGSMIVLLVVVVGLIVWLVKRGDK